MISSVPSPVVCAAVLVQLVLLRRDKPIVRAVGVPASAVVVYVLGGGEVTRVSTLRRHRHGDTWQH